MPTPQRSYISVPRETGEAKKGVASRIRGKDTKPEMIVRKYLWAHGFRFRLNHPRLPGKPDVVLRKYRTCVFVNGCFWHGHNIAVGEEFQKVSDSKFQKVSGGLELQSSDCYKIPKTNTEFWVNKILRNKARDKEVQHKLAHLGWHCITIWECELKQDKQEQTLESLAFTLNHIFLQDRCRRHDDDNVNANHYVLPVETEYRMVAENINRDNEQP